MVVQPRSPPTENLPPCFILKVDTGHASLLCGGLDAREPRFRTLEVSGVKDRTETVASGSGGGTRAGAVKSAGGKRTGEELPRLGCARDRAKPDRRRRSGSENPTAS